MSNPAVITLAEKNTSCGCFRVEDNIGESIHIHLGDIRVDLTVQEFLDLSDDIEKNLSLYFKEIPGFNLDIISKEFFLQRSECWSRLESVKKETIRLSELLIDTEDKFGFVRYKGVKHSRVIKALNGDSKENDRRDERNYYNQSNQDRIDSTLLSLKTTGYDVNRGSIVLFNDRNNIVDGQHRAACLYYLNGDMDVIVHRFYFSKGLYSSPKHPIIEQLFKWNKERLVKYIRKAYRRCRRFGKSIQLKIVGFRVRIDKYKNRMK